MIGLDTFADGSLLITPRAFVAGEETLAVMRRVRALLDESPRRLVCDLRAVTGFEPAVDAFARGMLQGAHDRILEMMIVVGPHEATRACAASAAFLRVPFVFRDTPPTWALEATPQSPPGAPP